MKISSSSQCLQISVTTDNNQKKKKKKHYTVYKFLAFFRLWGKAHSCKSISQNFRVRWCVKILFNYLHEIYRCVSNFIDYRRIIWNCEIYFIRISMIFEIMLFRHRFSCHWYTNHFYLQNDNNFNRSSECVLFVLVHFHSLWLECCSMRRISGTEARISEGGLGPCRHFLTF